MQHSQGWGGVQCLGLNQKQRMFNRRVRTTRSAKGFELFKVRRQVPSIDQSDGSLAKEQGLGGQSYSDYPGDFIPIVHEDQGGTRPVRTFDESEIIPLESRYRRPTSPAANRLDHEVNASVKPSLPKRYHHLVLVHHTFSWPRPCLKPTRSTGLQATAYLVRLSFDSFNTSLVHPQLSGPTLIA
jgi:hypothetical protein